MSALKDFRFYLGWGPMALSREYEIRAVEKDMRSSIPPDAPSEALSFNRMDYYRNQILVMTAFMTLMMLFFVWFFFSRVMVESALENGKASLLVGVSIGFGYGIYQTLKFRKSLFKEGRLIIGHKKPKSYKLWVSNYLILFGTFLGIGLGLNYFLGAGGLWLVVISFGCSYSIVQWGWYIDLTKEEKKQNKKFIWKPQGWYREVLVEPISEMV